MTDPKEHYTDNLLAKIKSLNETVWEGRAPLPAVRDWLSQFAWSDDIEEDEQLQMLFLLTNFMYFNTRAIRALLRAVFRDLYRYHVVEEIRLRNGGTRDRALIDQEFRTVLAGTRFLGVGNPSESGSHLLYYFRQENRLGKNLFMNSFEIFDRQLNKDGSYVLAVRDPSVQRYVFIDDICGSGQQAEIYSSSLVEPLKAMQPGARISYYVLFATTGGIEHIRSLNYYDYLDCIFELDGSFKCFEDASRIYQGEEPVFVKGRARDLCLRYGEQLVPSHPLGYRDGQLLLGFSHNTPDNTLPVFWYEEPDGPNWRPMFRRYPKGYGW